MRSSTRLAVLLLLLSLVAPSAWASPILTLQQQGSSLITVNDDNGDGIVTFAGSVGSYVLNFTAGKSTASAESAVLDLFSFDLKATFGANPLIITLTDSNFSLPTDSYGTVTAEGSVEGSMYALGGGTVTFQSKVNQVSLFSPAVQFSSHDFSATTSKTLAYVGGPFTLFSKAVVQLNGPGAILFNQRVSVKAVPEPGSLGLLAVGVLGARVLARRRATSRG